MGLFFSFQKFEYVIPLLSSLLLLFFFFVMRSQLLTFWDFFVQVILLLSRFSHCLCLSAFLQWCIWIWVTVFILLVLHWISCMCWLMLFIKCGKFSAIISGNIFFYSFLSVSGIPIMPVLVDPSVPYFSVYFSSVYFLSVLWIA